MLDVRLRWLLVPLALQVGAEATTADTFVATASTTWVVFLALPAANSVAT